MSISLILEIRDHARPADLSFRPFPGIIDMHHGIFFRYALYRTQANPGQSIHLRFRMTRLQQDLHFMALEHS